MDSIPIIFLAIAIFIIAMAFLLSWAFRKTIKREKRDSDLNGRQSDGDATATWIGIENSNDD